MTTLGSQVCVREMKILIFYLWTLIQSSRNTNSVFPGGKSAHPPSLSCFGVNYTYQDF